MHAVVSRNASETKIEVSSIEEARTASDAFRRAGKPFEITVYRDKVMVYWCNWSPHTRKADEVWRM